MPDILDEQLRIENVRWHCLIFLPSSLQLPVEGEIRIYVCEEKQHLICSECMPNVIFVVILNTILLLMSCTISLAQHELVSLVKRSDFYLFLSSNLSTVCNTSLERNFYVLFFTVSSLPRVPGVCEDRVAEESPCRASCSATSHWSRQRPSSRNWTFHFQRG